jgi:predicted metal-dependent hydrolase
MRSIRLRLDSAGKAVVSAPVSVSITTVKAFVQSKQAWLVKHASAKKLYMPGDRIGLGHRLAINQAGDNLRTRLKGQDLVLTLPGDKKFTDDDVQKRIETAVKRLLTKEAERLLLPELSRLAKLSGYTYKSAKIKPLSTRWGSCSHQQEIVLNCFLLELSWPEIRYVLMHELVHTRIMSHSPTFWAELDTRIVDMPKLRKLVRSKRPGWRN